MRHVDPADDEATVAENRSANERLASLLGEGPPPSAAHLPTLRRQRREGAAPFPPPWRHREAVDGTLDGPGGPFAVAVRTLTPPGAHGTYLHVVGGGWCTGSADLGDAALWSLATAAGVTAVCVAPRLAPEQPFPAPVDDVVAAIRTCTDGDEAGDGPLVVGGDSTGAHLALAATLRLRDELGPLSPVVALDLAVGIFDLTDEAPWRRAGGGDPLLRPDLLARYVDWFVPEADRRAAASPGHASLGGLPPLLVTAAGLDPLRDDSLRLAAAAEAAGVDVTLLDQPGASHAFATFDTAMARHAGDVRARFVAAHTVESSRAAKPPGALSGRSTSSEGAQRPETDVAAPGATHHRRSTGGRGPFGPAASREQGT